MFLTTLALKYFISILLYIFIVCVLYIIKNRPLLHYKSDIPLLIAASGRKKWLLGKEAVLGRHPQCNVCLSDPYVSSRHAKLFFLNGKYFIEDLGSTNGTYLNGQQLYSTTCIKPGDSLRVGQNILIFDVVHTINANKKLALLFFYPGFLLASGTLMLFFERLISLKDLKLALIISVAVGLSSLLSYKMKGESLLFLFMGVLTSLGLIYLYRIEPSFGTRQSYWVLTGLLLFWLTRIFLRNYNYKRLIEYKYVFLVLGFFFLGLTIFWGTQAGVARSWLSFGSFHFQPSEFVKIFMVIFLAGYLDENKEIFQIGTKKYGFFTFPDWPYLGPLLAACGLSLLLLIFQHDLGMALLFYNLFLVMFYVATNRFSYLVSGFLLFIGSSLVMFYLFPHVQMRVAVYLNPWQWVDQGGYQILQSLFALGGGGILGMGLGSGFPELIPAVHTDFIFSLIGEELGLIGTLGIVFIYIIFYWHCFQIALQAKEGFGKLLAIGFSSFLAIQTLIIIGGGLKLIPVTGVTLPFLSYGGSSFVSNCLLMGILVRISEEKHQEEEKYVNA